MKNNEFPQICAHFLQFSVLVTVWIAKGIKKPSEMGELGGDGDRGLYFNRSVRTECEVLVVRDIAELVGQTLCVADKHVLVVMGVAVYPIVYCCGFSNDQK